MDRIRYIGLGDSTGYGIAGQALVRALDEAGAKVAWEPLVHGPGLGLGYETDPTGAAGPARLRHLRDDMAACGAAVLHLVPEYYPHYAARERARSGGRCRVWGSTVWETDSIPAHWPALIHGLDGLIVPTEWNRAVFRKAGVTIPIAVVPHLPQFGGAAPSPDARTRLARRLPPADGRLVFYSIAAWLERKGIAPLLQAFGRAFGAADPVRLVLKTTAFDLERRRRRLWPPGATAPLPVRPQFDRMRRATGSGAEIVLLADDLPEDEIQALHALGGCYVSLCRAEGWGLGAFDAAFCGRPVIMTGWGGQLAFLTAADSQLVDYTLCPVRPATASRSYTTDQNWAEPDIASAVAALRKVAADLPAAQRRAAALRDDLRRRFAPGTVVQALLDALRAGG